MSRAILLPVGTHVPEQALDPAVIMSWWFKHWPKWRHVAPRLHVYEQNIGHGPALTEMVPGVDADYLMFIENDALVFNPDFVEACFGMLESDRFDVIGSPRMSCSLEIAQATQRKHPDFDFSGVGDVGPGMWPCFFFAKKEWLMKTDLHFAPKGWQPGEYIEELDLTAEIELATDVNGWMVFQLRHLGAQLGKVAQHHLPPFDMKVARAGNEPFGRERPPWIHIGSLSAGLGDPGNDELMQYEYGRRKFFMEYIATGQSEDTERYTAYDRLINP